MKKQIHNIAASAFIVTLMLTLAGTSFANWQGGDKAKDPARAEQQEAVHLAIESGDYETFKALLGDSEHAQQKLTKITADNFSEFQRAHALMTEGHAKIKEGQAILSELGLNKREGFKKGGRFGHKGGMNKAENPSN